MTASRGPLFDPVFGSADLAEAVSDHAWIVAMLAVEAALAAAAADVGLIERAHADAIGDVTAELSAPGAVDITALGAASATSGNPVIPLVKTIRAAAATRDVPAAAVHLGATSQDVLDTALVLMLRNAGADVVAAGVAASTAAARLAEDHRDTPIAGRTLGQQALPTTFGVVAAGWAAGLHAATAEVAAALDGLTIQFGGAAGTLAAVHPHGLEMADALALHLQLTCQSVPWHTDRTRIARVATALGVLAGAAAKPAGDIVLLAATEIAEVSEDAPGGSSAMPHKRNPVAAITARGAAARVPGAVATMLASMAHEHQRAAGPWHAEWESLTDIVRLTGGAVTRLSDSLTGLHVHSDSMARNLDATHGLLLAERVTTALSEYTDNARDIVTTACRTGMPLDRSPAITEYLDADSVRTLLDPAGYLGHAGDLVDRTLNSLTAPDRKGAR